MLVVLIKEYLFSIKQRIMMTQIVKRVINKIQQFKKLMQGLGYSQSHILVSLAAIMNLKLSKTSEKNIALKDILNELMTLENQNITKIYTEILINLQICVIQLKDNEESDHEDILVQKPQLKKQKAKKKINQKKKNKKVKQSALYQIREKVLMDTQCQKIQILQNLQKIDLIKQFLQKKVLLDLYEGAFMNPSMQPLDLVS